tara:strand:+ start:225 stop:371 length:147 start_codon:yes stop_codon:yes gene_type:complete
MTYLSPEIEALVKRKKEISLIKKEISCGIFQDYGKEESNSQNIVQSKK